MKGTDTPVQGSGKALALLLATGMLVPVFIGCEDHRISLKQFLLMEKDKSAHPTTAPAGEAVVSNEVLDQELGPYKAGMNDVLTVALNGLDTATSTAPLSVRVDREGAIDMPAIGKIKVEGQDLIEIEKTIRTALVPKVYQDISVHVNIAEPDATRVVVYGAVMTPGLVSLRRTERNLLYALNSAGGVSSQASGKVSLRRLRDSGKTVTYNLLDPDQLKTALSIDPLAHGDVISVEAAVPNTVFVGGLVVMAHPQSYPPGTEINVLQAIAAAGGLRTDVTPREGTLIRKMPDGTDVHVKLNFDRLTVGKDPNITLVAGDVLWVPDTLETRIQDWVNKNIFIRAGATATYGANYQMEGLDFFNNAARNASTNNGSNSTLQDQFDPFGFLRNQQAVRQATP